MPLTLIALLAALVVWAAAPAALAADGVLEINQACAAGAGCFSGDSAGFPVTIDGSAGRSYRLTGDLVVPDENTDGIRIATHDVDIDLGFFTIISAACVGAASSSCQTPGSGQGISVDAQSRFGNSVANGSITGMGSTGVALGIQSSVTRVRARWNFTGIFAGEGSTVSQNTAYENDFQGIFADDGSTVLGNTVYQNGRDGILTEAGATVSGNTARANGNVGIRASSGSTVSGNTATGNGGHGIQTASECLAQRNTVQGNTGFGLRVGNNAAYRENVINGNTTGTVLGGVDLGANSCNGAASCP